MAEGDAEALRATGSGGLTTDGKPFSREARFGADAGPGAGGPGRARRATAGRAGARGSPRGCAPSARTPPTGRPVARRPRDPRRTPGGTVRAVQGEAVRRGPYRPRRRTPTGGRVVPGPAGNRRSSWPAAARPPGERAGRRCAAVPVHGRRLPGERPAGSGSRTPAHPGADGRATVDLHRDVLPPCALRMLSSAPSRRRGTHRTWRSRQESATWSELGQEAARGLNSRSSLKV